MNSCKKYNVVVIGTGNVASAFIHYMLQHRDNINIISVYSRRKESLEEIECREHVSISYCSTLSDVPRDADIYLFSLSDNALESVWKSMPQTTGLWIHTAGSVSVEAMSCYHRDSAVLYPLQSINKNNMPSVDCVPIFIEALSTETKNTLFDFSSEVFPKVYWADSKQRKALHLAAVFACNFTNHLYSLSYDMLQAFSLEADAIAPLIEYTAQRVQSADPREVQTGPAQREDSRTIEAHCELLKDANDDIKSIYDIMTNSIINRKHYNGNNYFHHKHKQNQNK